MKAACIREKLRKSRPVRRAGERLHQNWQGRTLRRTRNTLGAVVGSCMFIVAVGRAAGFTQPAELKTEIPLGAIMRGPRGKVAAANPEILSPEVGHDHSNTVRWASEAILLKHAPAMPVEPRATVA